jgi:hypothetical protein
MRKHCSSNIVHLLCRAWPEIGAIDHGRLERFDAWELLIQDEDGGNNGNQQGWQGQLGENALGIVRCQLLLVVQRIRRGIYYSPSCQSERYIFLKKKK